MLASTLPPRAGGGRARADGLQSRPVRPRNDDRAGVPRRTGRRRGGPEGGHRSGGGSVRTGRCRLVRGRIGRGVAPGRACPTARSRSRHDAGRGRSLRGPPAGVSDRTARAHGLAGPRDRPRGPGIRGDLPGGDPRRVGHRSGSSVPPTGRRMEWAPRRPPDRDPDIPRASGPGHAAGVCPGPGGGTSPPERHCAARRLVAGARQRPTPPPGSSSARGSRPRTATVSSPNSSDSLGAPRPSARRSAPSYPPPSTPRRCPP